MKGASRVPRTAALVYWLALVGGLAVLTALRIDEPEKTLPVWFGALTGTALGQILSWSRLRLWLGIVLAIQALWLGPLLAVLAWQIIGAPGVQLIFTLPCFLSFVAATACGYFSLTERGALFACWFPTVVWMVSILDGSAGGSLGAAGWLLPSCLVVVLVAFMYAHEARRVAIWRAHADVRLAEHRRPVMLRTAPLGSIRRTAWLAAVAGATLALAASIAPHLWQTEEELASAARGRAQSSGAGLAGTAGRCCPERVEGSGRHVQEYLLLPRPQMHPTAADTDCVPCTASTARTAAHEEGTVGATAAEGPITTGGSTVSGGANATAATGGTQPSPAQPAVVTASKHPVATNPQPPPLPHPANAPRPERTPPVTRHADAPAPAVPTVVGAAASVAPPPKRPLETVAAPPRNDAPALSWVLLLITMGIVLHLGVRALRRLVTLRHLERPLWAETLDQRVSNLWQLALIGLRDAGYRTAPGEQPRGLARRVGIDGVEVEPERSEAARPGVWGAPDGFAGRGERAGALSRDVDVCAAVLERARHGVRVDAGDLSAMTGAARRVYRTARSRIGWLARVASWLRWPLA